MKNEFLTRIENIVFNRVMQDWPECGRLTEVSCEIAPGLKLDATVSTYPNYNEQSDTIRGFHIEFDYLALTSGDGEDQIDFKAACRLEYLSFYRAIPSEYQSENISPDEMFDTGSGRI